MTTKASKKTISHSSLALALALVFTFAAPHVTFANSPKEGAMMTPVKNDEHRLSLLEHHEKVMAEMKAQDAELEKQLAAIKTAPDEQKMDLMVALLSSMVQQRAAMHENMATMMDDMSKNQMPHLSINGMESMSSRATIRDKK